jgi:predicted amino acid-binding ACT domain protein
MASAAMLKRLLGGTTLPQGVVEDLLAHASALWLASDAPAVLAADLALCHPPLAPAEVRAVVLGGPDDGTCRLTVVSHDRPGLLADTAAVLAAEDVSVLAASAMTWTASGLALHSVTIGSAGLPHEQWERLALRLRAVGSGDRPDVAFKPAGRAAVQAEPAGPERLQITVTAPDQVGLLWAICRWLADHGASIEAAQVGGTGGKATDVFVVSGHPDISGLQASLTGAGPSTLALGGRLLGATARAGIGLAGAAIGQIRRRIPGR